MPNSSQLPDTDDSLSNRVIGDQVRLLAISQLDERLERYRPAQPKLEQQMLKSLRDYGQLSPVVVCQRDGHTVLVDGFKRLRAARTLKGQQQLTLSIRSARYRELSSQLLPPACHWAVEPTRLLNLRSGSSRIRKG